MAPTWVTGAPHRRRQTVARKATRGRAMQGKCAPERKHLVVGPKELGRTTQRSRRVGTYRLAARGEQHHVQQWNSERPYEDHDECGRPRGPVLAGFARERDVFTKVSPRHQVVKLEWVAEVCPEDARRDTRHQQEGGQ